MKTIRIFTLVFFLVAFSCNMLAQINANEVLEVAQRVNNYFMQKYEDPTVPTNVNKIRPSNLWTRAVYYEGLMALHDIDPQQRYIDYATTWANFHQWLPRNGINTCDADDQCCGQTYVELLPYTGRCRPLDYVLDCKELNNVRANLAHQMQTPNPKNGSLYGWWTWIDAIQMAMPLYMQMYQVTGDENYLNHAMKMYRWTRNDCGGGLFNVKEGLWWRDADYVPPYKEPDGQQCYWSRGNGWVYAALVRCMNVLPKKSKAYKELKKDFVLMSEALLKCQREDGFWNPSLVSTSYEMPETSGTSLFLYGMAWGIQKGYLKADVYGPACEKAWSAMVRVAVHLDGFLGWMQGTGKDPSAGQPLSYDKVPD
ncbi:MAG: glycoside hydrolase family 88 protein, partial [Bacteroidaceae bacterium]|nr:glycoside hydrolase family 88 protein [Bacteroidaceae bacterium]